MRMRRLVAIVLAFAVGWELRRGRRTPGHGAVLAGFEKKTTVKVLPNGLTLIVCERPEAPVFSYYTLVDAGSADDPQGAQRPRAHVRAHGLQGHRPDRHHQLPG